jgi:hypothetical protein
MDSLPVLIVLEQQEPFELFSGKVRNVLGPKHFAIVFHSRLLNGNLCRFLTDPVGEK